MRLTALSLVIGPTRSAAAAADDDPMDQVDKNLASQPQCAGSTAFSICLSYWQMAVRSKSEIAQWRMAEVRSNMPRSLNPRRLCNRRRILDDRMTGSSGELIVLSMNSRPCLSMRHLHEHFQGALHVAREEV